MRVDRRELAAVFAGGFAGALARAGLVEALPHGDAMWQLRRRAPVVTVVVDRPERIGDWFAIADELTAETGVVTSEIVPDAVSATR
jgi:PII-like signaling protein